MLQCYCQPVLTVPPILLLTLDGRSCACRDFLHKGDSPCPKMYLLSCKHSKWGFYVKVVSESTKDLGGINCTVSGHAECLSSILVSNISERRFDSKWCLDSGLYIRNVLMSNDYASMHHVFSPSAEMKTTEWLNISHLICVRVLSMSTPFELAFAKSLRARSKATRQRPLICWLKIDKSHPAPPPKNKSTSVSVFAFDAGEKATVSILLSKSHDHLPLPQKAWKLTAFCLKYKLLPWWAAQYIAGERYGGRNKSRRIGCFFSNMHHVLWLNWAGHGGQRSENKQ